MAPEIILGQAYDGRCIDLFAAGVILFTLIAGHCPFYIAHESDEFYYYLVTEPERYWKYFAQ